MDTHQKTTAGVCGSSSGSSVPAGEIIVDCPQVKVLPLKKKRYRVIYPMGLGLVFDELPHSTDNYVLLSDEKTLYAAHSYLPSIFSEGYTSRFIIYDVENDKVLVPNTGIDDGGPLGGSGGYDVYFLDILDTRRIAIIWVTRTARSGQRRVAAPTTIPSPLLTLIEKGDYVTLYVLAREYDALKKSSVI